MIVPLEATYRYNDMIRGENTVAYWASEAGRWGTYVRFGIQLDWNDETVVLFVRAAVQAARKALNLAKETE